MSFASQLSELSGQPATELVVGGPYPPVIWQPRTDGPLMAGSGRVWIEVPFGTALEDVRWVPDHPIYEPAKATQVLETYVHSSKDPQTLYKVTLEVGEDNELVSTHCTCIGFGYRRKCRHVEEARLHLGGN